MGEFLESTGKRYNVVESLGVEAFSRDLVSLDAILCNLAGFDMGEPLIDPLRNFNPQ